MLKPSHLLLAPVTALVALLTALVTALALLAAPPAATGAEAHHARASFAWGDPKTALAPVGDITAVACGSDTACVATLDSGHVVMLRNGRAVDLVKVASGRLAAVSCSSASSCVAVGAGGQAATYDGSRWKVRTIDSGRDLLSVSCVSASFCVAGDATGRVARFDGSAWTVHALSSAIDEVSCGSRRLCWALDQESSLLFRYGPGGWSDGESLAVGPGDFVAHVSCVSAGFCLATTNNSLVWQFDGDTWAERNGEIARNGDLSCGTRHLCVAADRAGFDVASVYDGSTWEPAAYDPFETAGEVGAACASTRCVVVDRVGARTFDGTTWERRIVNSPHGRALRVSCPQATFCAVTDDKSAATWNGTRWSKPRILARDSAPESGFPVETYVSGLACPTATFCETTIVKRHSLVDVAFPSARRWNGTAWPQDNGFPDDEPAITTTLACGAPESCIAIGQHVEEGSGNNEHYFFTLGGSGWTRTVNSGEPQINEVSCPTAGFCAFVISRIDGGYAGTGDTSGYDTYNQVSGNAMTHVSCASPSFCIAMDDHGGTAVWNGTTWPGGPAADLPGEPTGISCATASFCQAVDDRGYAVRWNGTAWGAPKRLLRGDLTGVSCASRRFCMAVAQDGKALVGRG